MATTVRITETYDLKTTKDKIGLVGVHTPDMALISKLYPGLMKNHRFIRFKKCDIVTACASVLPADPLQVGVTSGAIAPEDMFNPILYKAVTNESFDLIMARIYGRPDLETGSVVNGELLGGGNVPTPEYQFRLYYGLLASKGYRKAMPQSGFKVTGLVPICHTLISTYGNQVRPKNYMVEDADSGEDIVGVPNVSEVSELGSDGALSLTGEQAITFRGRPVKMPKFPLHFGTESATSDTSASVPKTYVFAMITPPAKLHEFFYRMRVTWTAVFEQVVPVTEFGTFGLIASAGDESHASNYTYSTAKSELESKSDMTDAEGISLEKIMES